MIKDMFLILEKLKKNWVGSQDTILITGLRKLANGIRKMIGCGSL